MTRVTHHVKEFTQYFNEMHRMNYDDYGYK